MGRIGGTQVANDKQSTIHNQGTSGGWSSETCPSGFQAGIRRPLLTDNALQVLKKRYLKRDENGEPIETPEDMMRRVAKNISQADLIYDPSIDVKEVEERFFSMMMNLEFLPNSPTLMNAGRSLQQLSACFVLPVPDSMEGIFEAVKQTALIHQSGGGTGFSFSRLRPKDDIVSSTMGKASGPVSFMTVFDAATETIKQGGTRRGANMGILRVDHPDIMEFITCKEKNDRLTNFNISVGLTEEFMQAVEADAEYDLINPRTKKPVRRLKAREVFNKIVEMAWKNGEPGICFLDRINRDNPTPHIGEIESTNPCGEQPLLPYESCNLGSINLSLMVEDGCVDWDRLMRTVKDAVHFLDNVIDMNRYPLEEIEKITKGNRKIGLGVMGWAEMLIKLGIPYNSEEAVSMADKVMGFIHEKAIEASEELAKVRGAFPNYKGSTWEKKGRIVRNATLTTIAPTGTISIIAGTSSGIEPLFALAFVRKACLDGEELIEVNPLFEEVARKRGFYSEALIKEVIEVGTLKGSKVPDDIKRLFVTAHDIEPFWHIRMQAAFQRHTDNAVSKTVNFPHDATKEDVAKVYMLAYKLGCKGVTVYRDGSREVQVLNKGSRGQGSLEASKPVSSQANELTPKPRGEITFGATKKMKTGCGNLYVTINEDEEGRPFEVFTQIGKAGGCAASQCEAIGRLTSLALRSGIQPEEVIRQLKSISCHVPVFSGSSGKILSCSDAVAKALDWYVNYKTKGMPLQVLKQGSKPDGFSYPQLTTHHSSPNLRGACPDCGGIVEHVEGCVTCRACGYTECG